MSNDEIKDNTLIFNINNITKCKFEITHCPINLGLPNYIRNSKYCLTIIPSSLNNDQGCTIYKNDINFNKYNYWSGVIEIIKTILIRFVLIFA